MKKVLVGGFFDILHSGHIKYFKKAKKYGDYLIVNISPDIRAKEKKGKNRPIFNENERAYIVKNIKEVDKVTIIKADELMLEEEYQKRVLNKIKPNTFVRTTFNENINNFCKNNEIEMVVLKETTKKHSTDIIKYVL